MEETLLVEKGVLYKLDYNYFLQLISNFGIAEHHQHMSLPASTGQEYTVMVQCGTTQGSI